MSEKQTYPNQESENNQDDFLQQAALKSQRSLIGKVSDTVGDFLTDKRAVASVLVGTTLVGGAVYAQHEHGEAQHKEQFQAAAEAYAHNEAVKQEINEKALAPVDPASIVGIFDIEPNTTIAALSEEVAEKQPEYQHATEAQQDFIDYTVLESAKAQGSYDLEDTFVVSKEKIDGKDTFVVQDGEEVANALTAPDTH